MEQGGLLDHLKIHFLAGADCPVKKNNKEMHKDYYNYRKNFERFVTHYVECVNKEAIFNCNCCKQSEKTPAKLMKHFECDEE